jgi:hypothetical protein
MNIPYNLYKVGLDNKELIMNLMLYFSPQYKDESGKILGSRYKTITNFLERHYKAKQGGYLVNGFDVVKICEILLAKNLMIRTRSDGSIGLNNSYLCNILDLKNNPMWTNMLNSIVYGFEYIYENNKDMVIPVVWDRGNGEYSAGTAFKFFNGIVTAKHCITDAKNLMIKGFSASELSEKHVYIHAEDGVDIAFIEIGSDLNNNIFPEDGKVLDEVLVMGYPKIPAFTDMITAEKTSIAAKAEVRQTTTTGSVVSFGMQYLMKCEMMLITAKITGGNSGGPVINDKGNLVGITSCLTYGEGDYDNLGYGIVSPVEYLLDIVTRNENRQEMQITPGYFRDWFW